MNRKEFLDRYNNKSEDEVLTVVLELGYDYDAKEFSDELVKQVDKVFKVVDKLPETKTITVAQNTSIAHQVLEAEGISIPQDILFYLVQSAIEQVRANAKQVAAISQQAFIQTLNDENQRFFFEIANAMQQNILSENSFFKEIANALSIKESVSISDVQNAIATSTKNRMERDSNVFKTRESQSNLAKEKTSERKIDIAAFLKEVNG